MVGTEFAIYIRYLSRTNSTTFTDAQIVSLANIVKDDMAKDIIKADERNIQELIKNGYVK